MGKLTKDIFNESCCDGGIGCVNDMSCQPCGCDKGANWICERHQDQLTPAQMIRPYHAPAMPALTTASTAVAPGSPEWRKQRPLWSGVLRYFPDALLEVAHVSWVGNEQHNPGEPLHWDRSKSQDEGDAAARHLIQAGSFDTDGTRHSAKAAWRALALLQKELEQDSTRK